MLTSIHVLLTLKCTNECDHCFLHCGPRCEATFDLLKLTALVQQIERLRTVETVFFEGGEPFLFYPLLLRGLHTVHAAGLKAGIVTNCYWATSVEDAKLALEPMCRLGIVDFSVSDDQWHRDGKDDLRPAYARQAAQALGIPVSTICIEPPTVRAGCDAENVKRGTPVTGGGVRFRGRAAEKLTHDLPCRPTRDLTSCPYEELRSPERVHVDAYGNVHICQGVIIGNVWQRALSDIMEGYDPDAHPVVRPLLKGGPAALCSELAIDVAEGYVDECHLCYSARKLLLSRYPEYLAPEEAYGVK